jgi:hypothetical protein
MPTREEPISTNDKTQPKVINKCTLIPKGSDSSILHISLKVSQLEHSEVSTVYPKYL